MVGEAKVVNPLRDTGLQVQRPDPCTVAIFGATGDLAHRMVVPALFDLAIQRLLPDRFALLGLARGERTDEQFRQDMREAVEKNSRFRPFDAEAWRWFEERTHYVQSEGPEGYHRLGRILDRLEKDRGCGRNRVFHLATPPSAFAGIAKGLGEAGLVYRGEPEHGWSRLVVEKPFGTDLESARELNRAIASVFRERDVFRIDHYLGKETVQNIVALRFANAIFEPVWNRRYVDHIQITAAETLGVEGRAGYYEGMGAPRDMVQNHLLQLLSLVCMEPPTHFGAEGLRIEKRKVLQSLWLPARDGAPLCAVRGQYGPGWVGGEEAPGYRQEPGVSPNSATETYAAFKLFVETWRWSGVPFYVRTGKRLPRKLTEIAVVFKDVPHRLFPEQAFNGIEPNTLVLRIQPNEGISLRVLAKAPGLRLDLRPVAMDFLYGEHFGAGAPTAYETLLRDVMEGDATLFPHWEEVEQSWQVLTPVLHEWAEHSPVDFPNYRAGSPGPAAADDMMRADGRRWRRL